MSKILTPESVKYENMPKEVKVFSHETTNSPGLVSITEKYGEITTALNPEFAKGVESFEGKYKIETPEEVIDVSKEIASLGGRALLVGGSVRDAVISAELPGYDLKPKDYDLEIYGLTVEQLQHVLELKFGADKIDSVGKSFGIIKVSIDGWSEPLDFSIPRTESKAGEGHKGFVTNSTPTLGIKEAAARRDFTCNALAYDVLTETTYDAFGGIEDIKKRRLEITDEKAFREDPLRVLRAAQFASRFDFEATPRVVAVCSALVQEGELNMIETSSKKKWVKRRVFPEDIKPDSDGFLSITQDPELRFSVTSVHTLESTVPTEKGLPRERIKDEFVKLLEKGKRPSVGFELLFEIGYIEKYWPELHALKGVPQEGDWHPEGDVWEHTMQVVDAAVLIADRELKTKRLSKAGKLVLALGALTHDFGKRSVTTTNEEGRIISWGHEEAGVAPAREFIERIFSPKDAKRVSELTFQVLPLVAEHMRPLLMYENQKNGIDQTSALRKLALHLSEGDKKKYPDGGSSDLYILTLVAKADKLGRNPDKGTPLSEEQVPHLMEMEAWMLKSIDQLAEANIPVAKSLLNGGDFMREVGITKPGPEVGALQRAVLILQTSGEVTNSVEALSAAVALYPKFAQIVKESAVAAGKHERDVWDQVRRMDNPADIFAAAEEN